MGFDRFESEPVMSRAYWIRRMLDGRVVSTAGILIRIDRERLNACRSGMWAGLAESQSSGANACPYQPDVEERGRSLFLRLSILIKRIDGKRSIVSPVGRDLVLPAHPEPREHLVNAIGLASRWHEALLESGGTLVELARSEGITEARIPRLLPLTRLGPVTLERGLVGDLPPSTTLKDFLAAAQRLNWELQVWSGGSCRIPGGNSARTPESVPEQLPQLRPETNLRKWPQRG
jgi:hypothetical protein